MRRWWPLLAVFALLAAAGFAAATVQLPLSPVDPGSDAADQIPTIAPTREQPSLASVAPSEFHSLVLPGWVLVALLGVAAAVVLTVLIVALGAAVRGGSRFKRRSIRRPVPLPAAVSVESELVAAVDAGLLELDESDRDPRRAVIACWVRLERAAEAAGTPRQGGDTPADLVLRLLAGHDLSEGVLTGFADVYRQARYSARHEVGEDMRDQARSALTRLRAELTASLESESGVPA